MSNNTDCRSVDATLSAVLNDKSITASYVKFTQFMQTQQEVY